MGGFDDGDDDNSRGGRAICQVGPFAFGISPIVIPHKNKARFVILTGDTIRQDAHMATPFQVLESAFQKLTVHKTIVESPPPIPVWRPVSTTCVVPPEPVHIAPSYLPQAPSAAPFYGYGPRGFSPAAAACVGTRVAPQEPAYIPSCRVPEPAPVAPFYGYGPRVLSPAAAACDGTCVPPSINYETVPPPPPAAMYYPPPRVVGCFDETYLHPVHRVQTHQQVWSQSRQVPVYEIIETNHTMILAGLMATFTSAYFPVALGVGMLGQGRWDVVSHRKVVGRRASYLAKELDPPNSLMDVQSWDSLYTDITWDQLRGLKIIAGLYLVASVGLVLDLEGIWEHRVRKEKMKLSVGGPEVEVITVSLSFKKQVRLKASAGVVPFLRANKDLAHAARQTQIKFRFHDIYKDMRVTKVLNDLIAGHSNDAVREAKLLADEYAQRGFPPEQCPIIFRRELKRDDRESRDRLRARIPLIANAQRVKKKRDREEIRTTNIGGREVHQRIYICEIIKRKDIQYPIESVLRPEDQRIYPERVGLDSGHHPRWLLDYRNRHYEEITQVRDKQQGDIGAAYEHSCTRFMWQFTDNYITREKFLHVLRDIGAQTGLGPILFHTADLPSFEGPPQRSGDLRESMKMTLELHLSEEDKSKVFHNLLLGTFVRDTLDLFAAYTRHPNRDYLQLCGGYSSLENAFHFLRIELEDKAKYCVNKARSAHVKMLTDKKHPILGPLSPDLCHRHRLHLIRNLFDSLKTSPFVFLTALARCAPSTVFELSGTSVHLERVLDVTLARNIMRNEAQIPALYRQSAIAQGAFSTQHAGERDLAQDEW